MDREVIVEGEIDLSCLDTELGSSFYATLLANIRKLVEEEKKAKKQDEANEN